MGCCFLNTQYNSSLPSFVPNFKILSQVVPEKSVTEIFPMHYIREREMDKQKIEKEGETND